MITIIWIRLHFLTINSAISFFIRTLDWHLGIWYIKFYIIVGRWRNIYSFFSTIKFIFIIFSEHCNCFIFHKWHKRSAFF